MDSSKLIPTLESIGKSAFINIYPELKQNIDITVEYFQAKWPDIGYSTWESRVSSSRNILKEGLALEALYHIAYECNRLNPDTINKAREYFNNALLDESYSVQDEKYNINTGLDENSENLNSYTEGNRKSVYVNIYERSAIARKKCIEKKGSICSICGFNFAEQYGEDIGRGFIHIHHIEPISTKDGDYKINIDTDLIPVCPNCHAMLHRKIDGKVISIEDLRKRIKKQQPE